MVSGKKVIISLLIALLPVNIWSQEAYDAEKAFFDANFETLYNHFEKAIDLYLELIDKGYGNENIYYLTGNAYLQVPGLKGLAVPWLEKAVTRTTYRYKAQSFKENKAPFNSWLKLGEAYQVTGQLGKARDAYAHYKKSASRAGMDPAIAEQYLESCDLAEANLKAPKDARDSQPGFLKVGGVNFNVAAAADGNEIVFMSDATYYHAIYFTQRIEGHWINPRNITMELESDGSYLVCSLSADGKTLFLSAPNGNNGDDIFVSRYVRDRWEPAKPASRKINSFHNETFASLSADGKQLLFVSDRPGGIGGLDIYQAQMGNDGNWDNITILGPPVNTEADENTPILSPDEQRLYFSTKGYPGMGGYDVFVSTLTSGKWGVPRNLGTPPNSTDDDLYYSPVEKEHTGYMAVYDHGTAKEANIHAFEFFSADHPRSYTITMKVSPPPHMSGEEKMIVTLVNAEHPEKTISSHEITPDEEPSFELPHGQYILTLASTSLQPLKDTFTVGDDSPNIINLAPLPEQTLAVSEPKTFQVLPVFFAFDKATPDTTELDKVRRVKGIMDSIPDLSLVIEGHTDNIGADDYNQRLSERRAQKVANILISMGIKKERLTIKGFGENNPVARNQWDNGKDCVEGRKLNRRVSFSPLEPFTGKVRFLTPEIPPSLRPSGQQ